MCNLRSRLGIFARYIRSCSTLQNFMCIMSYVSAAPSRARMAVGFPFERHRDGRVHSFCPWSRSRSSTGTMSALPSCERLPADSGVRGQAYYQRRASRTGLFAIVSLALHILRAICSFKLLSMSLNGTCRLLQRRGRAGPHLRITQLQFHGQGVPAVGRRSQRGAS